MEETEEQKAKDQRINEAFDRMIASLEECIASCGRISAGVRVLEELHQPDAEHFRRVHLEGGSHQKRNGDSEA